MIDIRALEGMHEQVRQFVEAQHPECSVSAVIGDTGLLWTSVSGVRHRFLFTVSLIDEVAPSDDTLEVKVAVLEDGTLRVQDEIRYTGHKRL